MENFSKNLPAKKSSHNAEKVDYFSHPEEWEEEYDLFAKENWQGLLKYRKMIADERVNCIVSQWQLGEAYIINGYYEKALNLLSHLYKENPEDPNILYHLLDVLFLLGLSEKDFTWKIAPKVFYLDTYILDICYDFLKSKRKKVKFDDLFSNIRADYIVFRDYDLFVAMQQDERFSIIQQDMYFEYAEVFINRKVNKKKSGHFCWCCQKILANEKFSGKDHSRHICKKCSALSKEEIRYRQEIRNIDRLVSYDGWVQVKNINAVSKFLKNSDSRVCDYAKKILETDKLKTDESRRLIEKYKTDNYDVPF